MPRARHKLQVSTFPFLAVLLCAMGSLILLLLVMDRRAKIVARNKARDVIAARAEERKAKEAAADEDWETQRRRSREALEREHAEVAAKASAERQKADEAAKLVTEQETRQIQLQQAVAREAVGLKESRQALQHHQAIHKVAQEKDAQARAERDKLGRDVAELETLLRELKVLKQRDRQTYSVVPYRGKHGDDRKPIYVECSGDGLVFHPDCKRVAGAEFTVLALRAEVERRAGGLKREKADAKDEDPTSPRPPYVLFLIRPDGVETYYKAQAALRGFRLDFGYEAVDQHWALDFGSGAPGALAQEPPAKVGLPPAPRAESPGPVLPLPSIPGLPAPASPGTSSPPVIAFPTPSSPKFTPVGRAPATLPPVADERPPASGPDGPETVIASTGQPAAKAPAPAAPAVAIPAPDVRGSGGKAPAEPTSDTPREPPAEPPTSRPGVPFGKAEKGPAPPLGNVIGNRDFVVTIVCFADHATVYPGGTQHWWKKAASERALEQAVLQNVQQLIKGRQASVRPGEPPYQPVLRFRVASEGLRTYLQLYPPLEALRVPMTREALDD